VSDLKPRAKVTFGRPTEAWKREAADFTPLLAQQLDALGEASGVDLTSLGASEVATAGGRCIRIVAQVEDGSEFVVENPYGRADLARAPTIRVVLAMGKPVQKSVSGAATELAARDIRVINTWHHCPIPAASTNGRSLLESNAVFVLALAIVEAKKSR